MTHVSRTHRVDLDWFSDLISLDQGVQIKYVNTSKHADILTRGSLTRETWDPVDSIVQH